MMLRFTFSIFLFFSGPLAAQSVFEITNIQESHQLRNYLEYYADTLNQTPEQINALPFVRLLDYPADYQANVTYWIRLRIKNGSSSKQFILTTDQWSEATLFLLENESWVSIKSGTEVPVKDRPLSLHRLLSFPMVIDHGESQDILLKVRCTSSLISHYAWLYSFLSKVELDESGHAYKKYVGNQLLVVFILGVTIILFFYNISLFFFERHNTSLILAVYFIVVSLVIANIHGLTTNYFFTHWQAFEMPLGLTLAHLTPIIVSVYIVSFFKLNFRHWEIYPLGLFILFMIFSLIYSLYSHQSLFYFERRIMEYSVYLIVLIRSVFKKRSGSKILLVAISATIVTSFFAEFKAVFFHNVMFTYPDFPYLIGVLCQVAIFSIATTYRFKILQHNMDSMRDEQRKMILNQNDELKIQVDVKTKQLQETLSLLRQQKNELEVTNSDLRNNSDIVSKQAIAIQELNEKLEELLRNQTRALASTTRDLDTFLYRTSHDLRRPLMTILGLSNLMKRETEIFEIHKMLELVNQTLAGLDRMLKKLIAIGFCYNEHVELEDVRIESLVHRVVSELQSADYGQAHFSMLSDSLSEDSKVKSNGYLLNAILGSILENAIYYGGNGVHITLQLKQDGQYFIIMISDNGPGIAADIQENIFEMFYRANEKSPGNGLGLYLVKIGVAKLGGKVLLESSLQEGTTITLFLPI